MEYTKKEMNTVLASSCMSMFLTSLASTMVNLALVAVGKEFSVSSHDLAMINTVYLMSAVVIMIPMTRVGDIFGLKKVFITGLGLLSVSAIVAFLSPSFTVLLLASGGMGAGAACVSVTGMALITATYTPQRRGFAIGINTTAVYIGLALGPTVGGFVTDLLGWRYIYCLLVPVALAAMAIILTFKKDIAVFEGHKFDMKGSALYAVAIFIMMYGVINLPKLWAIVLMIFGIILFAAFVKLMKRSAEPVMDFSVFKYKMFSRACVAAFMNYASSFSVSFFLALYLQHIGMLTPSQAGMVMLVQPLVQVFITIGFGSLSDRMADKRILPTIGMLLTCAGAGMMIFLGTEADIAYVVVILVLLGLGFGIFSAPNTSLIMSSVPNELRGTASGTISFFRQTGMMVSMGIAMCCISIIMGAGSIITPANHAEFVDVIRLAFTICFGMCVAGTAVSWFGGHAPEGSDAVRKA